MIPYPQLFINISVVGDVKKEMDHDFYNNKPIDFKYPEIGVCMEDTNDYKQVKLAIPIATPTLSLESPYDYTELVNSTRNIISDTSNIFIHSVTTSNYITIDLPDDIGPLKQGDKVILIFIGGDLNKPVILRRYT